MSPADHRLTVDQLLALAQQSLIAGSPGRAAALLRPLLELQPQEPRARLLMAQATLPQSPEAGLRHLRQAAPQAMGWDIHWILRARAEWRLRRPREAAASARRAVVLSPQRIDALFDGFSPIAAAGGRPEVWAFRSAVARPDDQDAWLRVAQAETDARRGTMAHRSARRAYLLAPADPTAALWLVRTAIAASAPRDQALVRRSLPAVAVADMRPVALAARSLALAGDLAAAADLAGRFALAGPGRADLLTIQALYLWRLGRDGPPRLALRRAMIDSPAHRPALIAAQSMAEKQRDYASALRWQRRGRAVADSRGSAVIAAELKALAVYRALLPRIDPARRTHRVIAAGLLSERQGAYHAMPLAPGWSLEAVAGSYHHRRHEADAEFCDLLWRLTADAVRPSSGRRIVDIGPADGLITIRSALAGATVDAIESTSLFAERVELFARLHGVAERVTVVRGAFGAEHLALLRAADVVVCLGVLYHLADIGGTLDLLARSGRPLLLETMATEEDWPDPARGRLHEDRLPVSWSWLLAALARVGYAATEIEEWKDFQVRRTGRPHRRMLIAHPAGAAPG